MKKLKICLMILLGTLFIISCKMPTDTTSSIDSKNTEISNEVEEIENNGILDYVFDEDVMVCDLEYIVIHNNKPTECSHVATNKRKCGDISVKPIFEIGSFILRIKITESQLIVTRYSGSTDLVINNVSIENNIVTIKTTL